MEVTGVVCVLIKVSIKYISYYLINNTHTHTYIYTQFPYRQCIDMCIIYQTLPHVSPIEIYVFLRAVIPRNTRRVNTVVLWQMGLAADVLYRCH